VATEIKFLRVVWLSGHCAAFLLAEAGDWLLDSGTKSSTLPCFVRDGCC